MSEANELGQNLTAIIRTYIIIATFLNRKTQLKHRCEILAFQLGPQQLDYAVSTKPLDAL